MANEGEVAGIQCVPVGGDYGGSQLYAHVITYKPILVSEPPKDLDAKIDEIFEPFRERHEQRLNDYEKEMCLSFKKEKASNTIALIVGWAMFGAVLFFIRLLIGGL